MGGRWRPARTGRTWRAGATAGLVALALLGTGLAGTAQAAYPGQLPDQFADCADNIGTAAFYVQSALTEFNTFITARGLGAVPLS